MESRVTPRSSANACLPVPIEQIKEIARALANRVQRPHLHQALIDTRLVDRGSSREELRKKFPDPASWVQFVTDGLSNETTTDLALRTLASLVNHFLRSGDVDHRIYVVINKARHAAERGDLQRVSRESMKLKELLEEVQIPGLREHLALLYIALPTTSTRRYVDELLRSNVKSGFLGHIGDAIEELHVEEFTTNSQTDTVTQPSAKTPASHAEPSTALIEADPVSFLRTRLTGLASPLAPPKQPVFWPVDEIVAQIKLPTKQIPWPSAVDVTAATQQLRGEILAAMPVEWDGAKFSIDDLPMLSQHLETIIAQLEKAQEVRSRVQNYRDAVYATAQTYLSELPLDDLKNTQHLLGELKTDSGFVEAVDALERVAESLHEQARSHVESMVVLVRAIQVLCVENPAKDLQHVWQRVQTHLLKQDMQGLSQLHDDILRQEDLRKALQICIQYAAKSALESLKEATPSLVSQSMVQTCLAAVLAGDSTQASESLKPPLPSTILTSASPIAAPVAVVQPTGSDASELLNISVALEDFSPRNRISAEQYRRLPASSQGGISLRQILFEVEDPAVGSARCLQLLGSITANGEKPPALLVFLLYRGLEAIERGSALGLMDHALDILLLSARATRGAEEWAAVGLLLLSVPYPGGLAQPSRSPAYDVLQDIRVQGRRALIDSLVRLCRTSSLEAVFAERFTQKEVGPFVSLLAESIEAISPEQLRYVREDIARSVGRGIKYGHEETVQLMLLALGRAAQVEQGTLDAMQGFLRSVGQRQNIGPQWHNLQIPVGLPDSLSIGLSAYRTGVTPRPRTTHASRSTGSRADRLLHVQIPVSVRRSGGFAFSPGSEQLEIVLLVSNPRSSGITVFGVEIVLGAARNKKLLARDVTAYVGALDEDARHLVILRLPLNSTDLLQEKQDISLGYELRWKESGSSETRFLDDSVEIPVSHHSEPRIEDYARADGKPILLAGEALRLSSTSVRDTLNKVQSVLRSGGAMAALVYGRRRRGKTSILETIKGDAEIRGKFLIVSDTLEDLPFRSLQQTYRHIGMLFDRVARRLNVQMESLAQSLSAYGTAGWSEIQEWLEQLESKLPQPQRVLFLIDEFHKWITALDVESRTRVLLTLRGMINRPDGGKITISIILSGLSNVVKYTRSSADFTNAFKSFEIRHFSQAEAEALVRANVSIEFDTRAVVTIRDLAGGNPFLINLLGSMIVGRLRQFGRPYCFPEDVEGVVRDELEDQHSRVRSFVQYLLKQGEEDHAAEIPELPALVALAWTLEHRGTTRRFAECEEIAAELRLLGVECDPLVLEAWLATSRENELVEQEGVRHGFATRWLALWLGQMYMDQPLPVCGKSDPDLVLTRYKIIRLVDKGGQATVYEARDTRTESRVILKIYPRLQSEGDRLSCVHREADALGRIEHTGVVRCLDTGTDPDKGDVIVLEYVNGHTLRQLMLGKYTSAKELIGTSGTLRVQVTLIQRLANALAECHQQSVIHKDIKPENIMLSQDVGTWLPKLVDFGLATDIMSDTSQTATMEAYTPGYAAPERPRRAAADVFSLGVVAYELISGSSPFPDPTQAIRQQQGGLFNPLKDVRTDVPLRLSELIGAMLSSDPSRRPNALALANELLVALDTGDWRELATRGEHAYCNSDFASALADCEQATFSAPSKDRFSSKYLDLLECLIVSAQQMKNFLTIAPKIAQQLILSVLSSDMNAHAKAKTELLLKFLKAIEVEIGDTAARSLRTAALRIILDNILDNAPSQHAVSGVEYLLKNVTAQAFWPHRDDIFLIGSAYRDQGSLALPILVNLCLMVCRKLRETSAALAACQLWLRRLERMDASGSSEYQRERDHLDKLLRTTATPPRVPRIALVQEPVSKFIGEKEKGHLNVEALERWATRLLRLYPYVQEVRRVRKDSDIPLTPNRILDLSNMAQHLLGGRTDTTDSRTIPAALDSSYCRPPNSALRINIILPEGTAVAEREAVTDLLRKDTSLFGEDE